MYMPILSGKKDKRKVPFSALDESRAIFIHGQTLSRIAERGGMSAVEIYANVNKIPLNKFREISAQSAEFFVDSLIEKP